MSLINFHSLTEINRSREIERNAREHLLSKAKQRYEREEQKQKVAKEKGETTWMLPSVEDKLYPKKKKKKKHKHKTSKKKDAASSSDFEEEKIVWVEKPTTEQPKREEWMELSSLFKTQTREQMKIADGSSRVLKNLKERQNKEEKNKPGSHSRELNPYYKERGSGLPSSSYTSTSSSATSSYDSSWLRKALQRAKDQAAQEGRNLEDIAKERWGSLEAFYKLLEEAEGKPIEISAPMDTPRDREMKEKPRRDEGGGRNREKREYRSSSRSSSCNSLRSDRKQRHRNRTQSKRKKEKRRSRNEKEGSGSSESSGSSSDRSYHRRSCGRSKTMLYKREDPREEGSSDTRSIYKRKQTIEDKYDRMSTLNNRPKKLMMLKPQDNEDSPQAPLLTTERSKNADVRDHYGKMSSDSWRKKRPDSSHRSSKTDVVSKVASSSESSSGSEEPEIPANPLPKTQAPPLPDPTTVLTDKEMNLLAAKLTKAELLGNEAMVQKLKSKLEAARASREMLANRKVDAEELEHEQVVVLTRTDSTGFTRPIAQHDADANKRTKKTKSKMYDHDGKRVSYFADDFKNDLQSMFEREKTTSAADQIADLEKMACSNMEKLSDDFDVDDMFISKVAPKESRRKEAERDRQKAIWEHQKSQKALDSCHFCVDNKLIKKHLIVALGKKCYISLPHHQSLAEGHCFIVPLDHIPCATRADEDLWEEIMIFRQALVRMFSSSGEDCIFFETATRLHRTPHMVLQCVPLPKESGELAPIYFKKAILECDEEWAQNKRLIDLKGRSVRSCVPKGLPYFCVDFGMSPGFAHVVENENLFPNNFAQEIIGGMMDMDFSLYRKPKLEVFEEQRKKVLAFSKAFKSFDPTQ